MITPRVVCKRLIEELENMSNAAGYVCSFDHMGEPYSIVAEDGILKVYNAYGDDMDRSMKPVMTIELGCN